ncbi:MAG: methylenetetrahydrofolate reductase [bacterium]|nr:methylenetetrahydrofolate reductase [bacterium]
MKTKSRLKTLLESGEFVVTAELGPPKGVDIDIIKKKASFLKGNVDAINITDNQTAVVRMSSIAAGAILVSMGLEPVIQMVTRDRNRVAMQSDLIGAAALGIKNVLCLSGDHHSFGNQPHAKNVFDIDSTQLLSVVKRMREENKVLGVDEEFEGRFEMYIGAAANPFAEPLDFRPYRLKKKVEAGADFIQTQCIFDISIFKEYMKQVRALGLHEHCHILAGVIPLKSAGMTRYMANNVPGIQIPENILKRMNSVPKEKAGDEGIAICIDLIEELKEIEGVHGIHLMAIEWEHRVPEIVERAKLKRK